MTDGLYEKALAHSQELGYRVGRDWLIENGADHAESYQLMFELAMAGVPYRYKGQDALLSKKAGLYLSDEQVEQVRALYDTRPTQVDLGPVKVVAVEGAFLPAPDTHQVAATPDAISLARIRSALAEGLNARIVDELTPKQLIQDAEKLGQFAARAHATLGAYLVYVEAKATPDDFAAEGYTSMKSWIEERVPVGYSVALKLMQVARVYMDQGGISLEELEGVSYTKLHAAVNLAQEKGADYAFEMAKSRTLKELQQRLFDPNPNTGAKGTEADDEESRAKTITMPESGEPVVYLEETRYPMSLVQLWEQQMERVRLALRQASVTDSQTNALAVMINLLADLSDEAIATEAGYLQ